MGLSLVVILMAVATASRLTELIQSSRVARLYTARSKEEAVAEVTRVISSFTYSPLLKHDMQTCFHAMYESFIVKARALRGIPKVVSKPKRWKASVEAFINHYDRVGQRILSIGLPDAERAKLFNKEVDASRRRVAKVSFNAFTTVGRMRIGGVETLMLTEVFEDILSKAWLDIADRASAENTTPKGTADALIAVRQLRHWHESQLSTRYVAHREIKFQRSLMKYVGDSKYDMLVIQDYSAREIAWFLDQLYKQVADFLDSIVNSSMSSCYEKHLTDSDAADLSLRQVEEVHSALLANETGAKHKRDMEEEALRNCIDSIRWYTRPCDSSQLAKLDKLTFDFFSAFDAQGEISRKTSAALDKVVDKVTAMLYADCGMNLLD